MLAVIGSFRLLPERIGEAISELQCVVAETLKEPGCLAYSYAEDIGEPGLFRVTELWTTRAALEVHFTTPHMRHWAEIRPTLGFHDRHVMAYPLGRGEQL